MPTISNMFDLAVSETLNGGDLLIQGNDLAVVRSYENVCYLSMFGGNVEGDTPALVVPGSERVDWWGNSLLEEQQQFNSRTERTLNKTPIGSAARSVIESAIRSDLNWLAPIATLEIAVSFPGINTVKIKITVRFNDSRGGFINEFTYVPPGPETGGMIDWYYADFDPNDFL